MNYFITWSGFECHSSEGKPGALGAEGLSVPQYYVESDDQTEQHWNAMGFFLLCLAGLDCLLSRLLFQELIWANLFPHCLLFQGPAVVRMSKIMVLWS